MSTSSAISSFEQAFGKPAAVTAQAPGRVNLLGEHTDYNDGYVLPTALRQHTQVQIAPSTDAKHHFCSAQFESRVSYGEGESPPDGYALYIEGCIQVLREHGAPVQPLMMFVDSSVPIGSGLSSSAALEIAVLRGLRQLYKLDVDDVQLALLAQRAEREFAKVNCGIMDQMVSSLGDETHLLFLDTRTLERKLLPFPPKAEIVVLDSGVPRALAASGYNERRAECEAAVATLGVRALRDVTDVSRADSLEEPLRSRARHVITENARVLEVLKGVDAQAFGRLMNDSHASLRDLFQVSEPSLDRLVDLLQRDARVYGAKLTGAGFGGACVALVEKGAAEGVSNDVLSAYAKVHSGGQRLV